MFRIIGLGSDANLSGPPLNEDDEFNSSIENGRLVYTLPHFSDLFNGLPLDTFE